VGAGDYRCCYCESAFHSGRSAVAHMASAHPGSEVALLLYIDDATGQDRGKLKGKVVEVEVERNEDTAWMERYIEPKSDSGLKACNLCHLSRSTRDGVKMHVLAAHFRYYPFKCWYCPKVALRVRTLKEHIETEHQGQPYKVTRRGHLSYEHAQEHRHKDAEMIHMLDPLPELMKDSADGGTVAAANNVDTQAGGDKPVSPIRRGGVLLCKYCDMRLQNHMYNMQKHILSKHLAREILTCNLCEFGTNWHPLEERMEKHFEKEHDGHTPSWTNHMEEISRMIVKVAETEEGIIVAVVDEKGKVLELDGNETDSSGKRQLDGKDNEPASKRPRTGRSPVRDLRQRGSPALYVDVSCLGIDVSKAMVASSCVERVEERITANRTLFGCSECFLLYDRKDKVCHHLQNKHNIKPYLCGICSAKFFVNNKAKQHMQLEHPESSVPTKIQEDVLSDLRARIITVMQHSLPNTLPIEGGGTLTIRATSVPSPQVKSPKQQCAKKSTAKPHVPKPCIPFEKFPYEKFAAVRCRMKTKRSLLHGMDTSALPHAKVLKWPPMTKQGTKYFCDYCTFDASNKQNMLNHVTRHTTWRKFSCKLCPFKCFLTKLAETHVETKHAGESPEMALEQHDQPETYYLNEFTLENLNLKPTAEVKSPRKPVKSPKRKPIKQAPPPAAPVCDLKNMPEVNIIKQDPIVYQCNFCVFARTDHAKVTEHQKRHCTPMKQFKCPLCSFLGSHNRDIMKHTKAKHGKCLPGNRMRPLKSSSETDQEKSPRKNSPKAKVQTSPRRSANNTKKAQTPPKVASPKGKSRKARASLSDSETGVQTSSAGTSTTNAIAPVHTKVVQQVPKPILVKEDPAEYKCNYCDFTKNMQSAVKMHQRTHYTWRPFACGECDFQCFKETRIHEHLRTDHNTSTASSQVQRVPEPKTFILNERTCASLGIWKEDNKPITMSTNSVEEKSVPASVNSSQEKPGPNFTKKSVNSSPNIAKPKPGPASMNVVKRKPGPASKTAAKGKKPGPASSKISPSKKLDPEKKLEPDQKLDPDSKLDPLSADGDEDPKFCIKNIPAPKRLAGGNYTCNFCPDNTVVGECNSISSHQLCHVTHRAWACKLCPAKFVYRSLISAHMEAEHPGQEDAMEHVKRPGLFYLNYGTRKLLGPRVEEFLYKEILEFKCPRCKEIFKEERKQLEHLAAEHTECAQFKCLLCQEVVFTKGDMDQHHIEQHGDELPDYDIEPVPAMDKSNRNCEICHLPIPNSYPLHIHMVDQHKGEVDVTCGNCSGVFGDMAQLRDHHANTRGHERKPMKYTVRKKIQHDAIVTCMLCPEKMQDKDLDAHLEKQHPAEVQCLCKLCSRLVKGMDAFKEHFQATHGNKIQEMRYSIVRNLLKESVETSSETPSEKTSDTPLAGGSGPGGSGTRKAEDPKNCSECRTLRGCSLRIHVMDVHFAYRPYMCCFCPFRAASVTRVKQHHYEAHPTETLQVKQRLSDRITKKVDEKLIEIKLHLKQECVSLDTSSSASPQKATPDSSPNKRAYKKLGVDIHILFSPKSKVFQCKICKMEAPKRITVYNHIYQKHKDDLKNS
jgi:hypothetical protein